MTLWGVVSVARRVALLWSGHLPAEFSEGGTIPRPSKQAGWGHAPTQAEKSIPLQMDCRGIIRPWYRDHIMSAPHSNYQWKLQCPQRPRSQTHAPFPWAQNSSPSNGFPGLSALVPRGRPSPTADQELWMRPTPGDGFLEDQDYFGLRKFCVSSTLLSSTHAFIHSHAHTLYKIHNLYNPFLKKKIDLGPNFSVSKCTPSIKL